MRGVNNIVLFDLSGTRPTPWFTTNSGHIFTMPEQVVKSQDGVLTSTTFDASASLIPPTSTATSNSTNQR